MRPRAGYTRMRRTAQTRTKGRPCGSADEVRVVDDVAVVSSIAMSAKGLAQKTKSLAQYHKTLFMSFSTTGRPSQTVLVSIDCSTKFNFSDLVAPEFRVANDFITNNFGASA